MSERTYTNPVHGGYLGDPFVLKHNGEYYAYGTVPLREPAVPVLHSRDLVNWRQLGHALTLPGDAFKALWAPEVAYDNGTFYMYYSAGGEEGEGHQLRVALASHPAGPFEDSNRVLTPDDPFTIDAHPFRDDDGRWYLYYCRDFLEPDGEGRVGTGIVVDRLVGMTRLAGERRTVVRPHADWQLYERQREWYGRVWDWYTVEGAFVRKHDGRYYCLYSGGAWREPNYGVSYVLADHPMGPFAPEADAEGSGILRTSPGRVVGPGHASVVLAPDNVHEYLVYHAWDPGHTSRQMRIDPLNWGEGGPCSTGPTLGPRPAPPLPLFRDNFDGPGGTPPGPGSWQVDGGDWRHTDGELVQRDPGARSATAQIVGVALHGESLIEANVRLLEAGDESGRYGVSLEHGPGDLTLLMFAADGSGLSCDRVRDPGETGPRSSPLTLGAGFRSDAYHRLVVSVRGGELRVWVDGVRVASGIETRPGASGVGLITSGASAAFDGVSVAPYVRR
ncbi:MAG TPA: glycoside hydrolase family 43 protein [Rubrobacter sp.]|nr:glycoside hydrolase family 43 protein [Rubrobacter sp.]